MPKNYINRKLAFLFIVVIGAILYGIVYLKNNAHVPDEDADADTTAERDNVAIPDTTIAPDLRPAVTDTVVATQPDSVGRDPRPADEAGAEDGYWNGYYDGVAGREMTEHDVSSSFPTREERDTYAINYTEGYSRGYEEGKRSKANTQPETH